MSEIAEILVSFSESPNFDKELTKNPFDLGIAFNAIIGMGTLPRNDLLSRLYWGTQWTMEIS